MSRPALQERHHDYVLGPRQDSRLTSVAAGAYIEGITLQTDADAPFVLRGRAVRRDASAVSLVQNGMQFLRTRWAAPGLNYRQQDLISEGLQMANYGQVGNQMPIYPGVYFPANSPIVIDIQNTGAAAIANLTFYWRGVKLYPWGTVPAYTYPNKFASLVNAFPFTIEDLATPELRQNQILTVHPDADFVFRGGQADVGVGTGHLETFFQLMDFNKKPYSNDLMHIDVLFGSGAFPASFPIGPNPNFLAPFGTGPQAPGLFYPEIYVPKNHQLLYNVYRGVCALPDEQDLVINLIGAKVFPQ